MATPGGKVTPRFDGQVRPSGLAVAILLHAGLVVCFALGRPPVPGLSVPADASPGAMLVTLVRSPLSQQAGAAEGKPVATVFTPARLAETGVKATTAASRGGAEAGASASASNSASRPPEPTDGGASSPLRTTLTGEAVGSEYQRRLLAHIESFKHYPGGVSARGVVQLVFEINRAGGILGIWVVKSSGIGVLDTAAVDTVRRAQPVPSIPPGLPDLLTVPVSVAFDAEG